MQVNLLATSRLDSSVKCQRCAEFRFRRHSPGANPQKGSQKIAVGHRQALSGGPAEVSESSVDRKQIAELLEGLSSAWNRGNGEDYARFFTQDCDYVAFDGTHIKGRRDNAVHHQLLFDTVLRNSRLSYDGTASIRFIHANVAIMHAMGSVLLPWQTRVHPRRRSYQTYVLVRTGISGWLIAAFHNSRVRPVAIPRGFLLRLVMGYFSLRTFVVRAFRSPTTLLLARRSKSPQI